MRGHRPFGVLVLSILEAIVAFFMFLGVAAFSALRLPGLSSVIGIIAGFGSVLLLLAGLALLFSAYGLWSGERWGWWLSMVIAGFLILTIVFLDIPGCIIGILVGYYLTRKGVKKWFGL
jgi:hypothetical protein